MDYFKQRRAYRDFKLYEEDVSMGQNNLYRELLDYANDKGVLDDYFKLKNDALASLTGLTVSGLGKARNNLVQMGLIEYEKGKKNTSIPAYKINCLYDSNRGARVTKTLEGNNQDKGRATSRTPAGQQLGKQGGQQPGQPVITTTDSNLTNTQQDVDNSAVAFWLNQVNAVEKPIILEQIQSYVTDFKDDQVVILAMKMTVENGANSFNYTKAILNSWLNSTPPLLTIDSIKAFEQQRKQKLALKKANGYGRKPVKQEPTPEWAKPDYKAPEKIETPAMTDAEFMALMEGDQDEN
ncbi:DnaD domain protein [Latilactobacillus sakei]|uniref:DnaD domain protein n=1 Tax=Latilactobacillus sakei TaxID=1599 RepID=UPI000978E4D7|nr:DnaD domain protein [Latilactobacillus sakei]